MLEGRLGDCRVLESSLLMLLDVHCVQVKGCV